MEFFAWIMKRERKNDKILFSNLTQILVISFSLLSIILDTALHVSAKENLYRILIGFGFLAQGIVFLLFLRKNSKSFGI